MEECWVSQLELQGSQCAQAEQEQIKWSLFCAMAEPFINTGFIYLPEVASADVWAAHPPEESCSVPPRPGDSAPSSSSPVPAEARTCCSEPDPLVHRGRKDRLLIRETGEGKCLKCSLYNRHNAVTSRTYNQVVLMPKLTKLQLYAWTRQQRSTATVTWFNLVHLVTHKMQVAWNDAQNVVHYSYSIPWDHIDQQQV